MSSMIDAVDYEYDTRRLAVGFRKSDTTYVYFGVEAEVAEGLVEAESMGRYFLANVKGKYPYEGPLV